MKQLLKELKLDAIYGLDAETYWASDYSLSDKTRGTTEYVTDERFELQLMSVQRHDWKRAKVMTGPQFVTWAKTINWSRMGMLAHNAHFDGLIASHHCDVKPAFYLDTLSMARACMPIKVGNSLNNVCQAFGFPGKVLSSALTNTKGKRWREFTKDEQRALKAYGGADIEMTWDIFHKMLPYVPVDELRIIDTTIGLYCKPTLLLEKTSLEKVLRENLAATEALIVKTGVSKSTLRSRPKFAELLRGLGVEPPTKIVENKDEELVVTLALSKQDQAFVDLLIHPDERVRDLVAAKFAAASNQMESRCKRLISRTHLGAQPVFLNVYGAHTLRWSGGDAANWQNLSSKRKEGGAELRASVLAPPGHQLIIADQGQIEARINCFTAGQLDVLEAFRASDNGTGPEVYKLAAAGTVYNIPIEDVTPMQRFIGKICVLMLGFQAGKPRFIHTLRIGSMGPPVKHEDVSDQEIEDAHTAWRAKNQQIVQNWKHTQAYVKAAFLGCQRLDDGVVAYEGSKNRDGTITGFLHVPGGMSMRYDDVRMDEDGKSFSYMSKYKRNKMVPPTIERTKLYGGLLVENRTQCLARMLIAEQIVRIQKRLGNRCKFALTTHDEIVGVVPNRSAEKSLRIFTEEMQTPSAWCPTLPLKVDAHISARYDK